LEINMASGLVHDESRLIYQLLMAGKSAVDRGTNLELRLFCSCPGRVRSTAFAGFVEPTSGGYAPLQLPAASLTCAGTMLTTSAVQTFVANVSGYSGGDVIGWFITTSGTTRRVLASELFDSGPYTMGPSATLNVTPQVDMSLG
jgi:hypothetical protein